MDLVRQLEFLRTNETVLSIMRLGKSMCQVNVRSCNLGRVRLPLFGATSLVGPTQ